MPRISSYFGPIDSSAVTHSAPQQSTDWGGPMQALGQGVSDLARVMMYDPARDPKAQQAAFYNAQAQGELAKNSRDQDVYSRTKTGQNSEAGMVQQVGTLLRNTPPEEREQVLLKFATDYTAAVAQSGEDPAKAYAAGRQVVNLFDTTGRIATAFDTAVTGQPLSAGQYFTDPAHQADISSTRETERLKLDQTGKNAMDLQTLQNTGTANVANIGAHASMYGADRSAGATLGAAGISAGASRDNARLSSETARRGQDMTHADAIAPKHVSHTTTVVKRGPNEVPAAPPPTAGAPASPLAAAMMPPPAAGGVPRPVQDAYPQIPEGARVHQGNQWYTKTNGQMVPS